MNKEQYAAFLGCALMPMVIQILLEKTGEDTLSLLKNFYNSEVYALLEDENTKMWHYSPLTIYEMFKSEIETGKIAFPEEAA